MLQITITREFCHASGRASVVLIMEENLRKGDLKWLQSLSTQT